MGLSRAGELARVCPFSWGGPPWSARVPLDPQASVSSPSFETCLAYEDLMNRWTLVITIALVAVAPCAFAQAPLVQTVQNTASNIPLTSIAPQVLVTIKGQHLAASTAAAPGFPLPTTLGGATVTFTGPNGPLVAPCSRRPYADQCPGAERDSRRQYSRHHHGGFQRAIQRAHSYGNLSLPDWSSRRLYADTSGCGQAVAYNVHPDGALHSTRRRQVSIRERTWA